MRSLLGFIFFFLAQVTVLLSCREGRTKLASVSHLTHFPTLTNATRREATWSDQPDEAGQHDPTKQPDLPVRRYHSPTFGQKSKEKRRLIHERFVS